MHTVMEFEENTTSPDAGSEELRSNSEALEKIKEMTGLQTYLSLFRLLPRPLRVLGYIGLVLMLPFYFGLAPKLAQDVFNEPLENYEIRLGWRDAREWTGRYSSGAVTPFTLSRWTGPGPKDLTADHALLVGAGKTAYYRLKSEVFSLYNFYVKFDVEIQKGQKTLNWAVRADRNHASYYRFRLEWKPGENTWRFDAFSVANGQDEEEPLFVNEHLLEVSPLNAGDKVSVLLYANGCIFDHRFLVDRNMESPDFAKVTDSGEGSVLAATAFAEKPCQSEGDFGIVAPDAAAVTKLQTIEICSQSDENLMKEYCGDFKNYYKADVKAPDKPKP